MHVTNRLALVLTWLARCREPLIAILGIATQQVQLMVAQNTLCTPFLDQSFDQFNHGRAIRAAIDKITYKYQTPTIRVIAILVVVKLIQQLLKRIDFTMDITDDINGTGKQFAD